MQPVKMHVDANHVSNVIFAFVFECYTFLGSGICDMDIIQCRSPLEIRFTNISFVIVNNFVSSSIVNQAHSYKNKRYVRKII